MMPSMKITDRRIMQTTQIATVVMCDASSNVSTQNAASIVIGC